MVFKTDHSKRVINTPGLGFADLPNQIYRRAVKVSRIGEKNILQKLK